MSTLYSRITVQLAMEPSSLAKQILCTVAWLYILYCRQFCWSIKVTACWLHSQVMSSSGDLYRNPVGNVVHLLFLIMVWLDYCKIVALFLLKRTMVYGTSQWCHILPACAVLCRFSCTLDREGLQMRYGLLTFLLKKLFFFFYLMLCRWAW